MTKLQPFIDAEQLGLDTILAEVEGNGLGPGDLVGHCQYPDFRGRVVEVEDGRAKVQVLDGWRGPTVPRWPVGIPTCRLEVLV